MTYRSPLSGPTWSPCSAPRAPGSAPAALDGGRLAVLRSTRARLGRWLPERELRARKVRVYDPRTGWWLPVLPDAAFEVVYPDGCVQACLLEVDLGTLTLKRFRRKVRAFELDLAQGPGAVLPVPSFEVLVLTHSQGRLQQLWRAARDEVSPERGGAYSFGIFDRLEPRKFREAHWVTAENNLVPLLYDDAFPAAATEPVAASAEADHEMADAAPARRLVHRARKEMTRGRDQTFESCATWPAWAPHRAPTCHLNREQTKDHMRSKSMKSLITYNERWRPYRHDEERTPLRWCWKRKVYERVFFPVWPLLLEGLAPVTPDGRYPADRVLARIPFAAERLADRTSPEEQETFLEAMDAPFLERVGPIEPGCGCRSCRQAERARRKEAEVPRDLRLRHEFIRQVAWHIESLLETPNAYDRRHGLPRLIRRYRHLSPSGGRHGS